MTDILSILVNGLTIGMAFFLAAAGLTILFGILRILNFAHGSFLMVGAYLTSTLLGQVGEYGPMVFLGISVISGLIVGLLGLVVHRFVFLRLHGVDEAVALIATFALMLLMNGGVELLWGVDFRSVDPPADLAGAVQFGGLTLPAFSAFILLIGVAVFILADLFLHRSWTGKALQSVAEDRWIMGILGHSPKRLEVLAIFIAFFLAGFAGSVLVPNQVLTPSLGSNLVIQAFAVVIVGGLGSVRGSFMAAMLLGIAESFGASFMPSLSVYLSMILILVLRPQGLIAPRGAVPPGSWSFSWIWRSGRRLSAAQAPARRKGSTSSYAAVAVSAAPPASMTFAAGVAALGAAAVLLPIWFGGGVLYMACVVLIGTVFAMSWNLMFGFGGLATFGHAAFFAIGSYLAAYVLKSSDPAAFVPSLFAAVAVGGVVAAVVGVVAIRRANGVQLAMLTLALAEVLRVVLSYSEALGRDEGLSAVPRPSIGIGSFAVSLGSDTRYYLFLCVACAAMIALLWVVSHGPFGRVLRSIRQDAQRALFVGINVDRFRLMSFILAGAVAAFAGALSAPLSQIVTPEVASIQRSTHPMLHTLVGGAGSFWGPAVGTAIFAAIEYFTRTLAGLSEVIMGGALLGIVLLAPGGAFGWAKAVFKRLNPEQARPAPAPAPAAAPGTNEMERLV